MTKSIYSRLNLAKSNNLEMAKPRMKEDRHETRKYHSFIKKFPNKVLTI